MLQIKKNTGFNQKYFLADNSLTRERTDFDLFVVSAGLVTGTRGYTNTLTPDHHSLHFVTRGSGTLYINENKYPVPAGAVFSYFPGMEVTYTSNPQDPARYYWVWISGSRAAWMMEQCGFSSPHPVRPGLAGPAVIGHLEKLAGLLKKKGCPPISLFAWAWKCADMLKIQEKQTVRGLDSRRTADIMSLLAHQEAIYHFSVADLARQLEMDRTTLFRHFKDVYGVSPQVYLDRLRMEKAVKLLLSTRKTIREVAFECGFGDPGYFHRVFKKRYNMTPDTWRAKY